PHQNHTNTDTAKPATHTTTKTPAAATTQPAATAETTPAANTTATTTHNDPHQNHTNTDTAKPATHTTTKTPAAATTQPAATAETTPAANTTATTTHNDPHQNHTNTDTAKPATHTTATAPAAATTRSAAPAAAADLPATVGMPVEYSPDTAGLGSDLDFDDLRLVVRCIDLTTLEGDDTPGRIRALCAEALRPDPADPTVGPVAAVCVHPALAGLAAELLAGTPVSTASVAGAFPSGLSPLEVKTAEVRAAVASGAQEIDTVLNRSAFLSGDAATASADLRALKQAAGDARFKVILEVCELGSAETIAEATRLAVAAGATMVKTSTGKGAAGASVEAVTAMAETIAAHCAAGGLPVGIKIAGGVRSAADAVGYVEIVRSVLGNQWLNPERLRFGASGLLKNVVAALTGEA
ncbi:MAG: deoxyribose-phosphate aldolase, partial [Acidimicrobiaceae bacterium]|nr:deoxyribose-phosphate aldolase [Acidimicrobiaceae bacterium]